MCLQNRLLWGFGRLCALHTVYPCTSAAAHDVSSSCLYYRPPPYRNRWTANGYAGPQGTSTNLRAPNALPVCLTYLRGMIFSLKF